MNSLHFEQSQCPRCSFGVFCLNSEIIELGRRKRHLKKGAILHSRGEPFKYLYAVKQGAIKTCDTDVIGNELIYSLYFKNEICGYDAIYKQQYFYTAVALVDTEVCEIAYPEFLELLKKKPNLLSRVLLLMSQQLTWGSYLKSATAQQRVAAFLLDLLQRLSTDHSASSFLLPMTYRDIGNYLNLATETISRTLSQLKKDQLISIENKTIYLFEKEALNDLAEGFFF